MNEDCLMEFRTRKFGPFARRSSSWNQWIVSIVHRHPIYSSSLIAFGRSCIARELVVNHARKRLQGLRPLMNRPSLALTK
jgi:hypothetical protein